MAFIDTPDVGPSIHAIPGQVHTQQTIPTGMVDKPTHMGTLSIGMVGKPDQLSSHPDLVDRHGLEGRWRETGVLLCRGEVYCAHREVRCGSTFV
jgi:hypothetical protein